MALLAGVLALPCCLAQQQVPAPEGGATGMTLHVTVRELQVAALVLDDHRRVVSNLDPSRFRLHIERRKPFPPMRFHRQGDDPFTLAVVMDVSHENRFRSQLPDALAQLRQTALLPHDRLLLFAVDCKGVVYRGNTGTPDNTRTGATELLASPLVHETTANGKPRTCGDRVHLFDEIVFALRNVAVQPGRHTVLVVSDGLDMGSIAKMSDLEEFATNSATTVFVQPSFDMSGPNVRRSSLEPLVMMSGGVVLDEPGKDGLANSFETCVKMLRERFILGFNQPSNLRAGHNELHVTVDHANYDIRSSGVSAPNAMPVSDKPQPDQPGPPPGVRPGQPVPPGQHAGPSISSGYTQPGPGRRPT